MAQATFLRHRGLLTAAMLGFVSGYVTSNTKLRFNTFGGMMTGNTVKLGMALAEGDWPQAGVYLSVLICFAVGTLMCLVMLRGSPRVQHGWVLFFTLMFVVVDAVALTMQSDKTSKWPSVLSALAALSLGAQNCLSQKSSVVKGNTTFMTGNIQKMAEAIFVHATKGLKPSEAQAARLLLATWVCYVLGGLLGGTVVISCSQGSSSCAAWSLSPVALLYGAGMLSMIHEMPTTPPPPAPPPPPPKPAEPSAAQVDAAAKAPTAAGTPSAEPAVGAVAAVAASESGRVDLAAVQIIDDARRVDPRPRPLVVLERQHTVEGSHPTSPVDGRRALGEEAQM